MCAVFYFSRLYFTASMRLRAPPSSASNPLSGSPSGRHPWVGVRVRVRVS